MIDPYIVRYIKAIKEAQTDDDLGIIIDNIYQGGFQDALNNYKDHEIEMP